MSRHRRNNRYEEENTQRKNPQGASTQGTNSPMGNFNISNLAGIINGIDVNQLTDTINRAGEALDNQDSDNEASNAQIIRALRTLINSDKAQLLQTVIQLYALTRSQKK